MPSDSLPDKSFCLLKSRGFAHLAALGLVSMMLHCANVKSVKLVGLKAAYRDAQDKLLWGDKTCPACT